MVHPFIYIPYYGLAGFHAGSYHFRQHSVTRTANLNECSPTIFASREGDDNDLEPLYGPVYCLFREW